MEVGTWIGDPEPTLPHAKDIEMAVKSFQHRTLEDAKKQN